MIANVSAHRRANAFAQALDEQRHQDRPAEQLDPAAERSEQGTPDADGAPLGSPAPESPGQAGLLALAAGLGELPAPRLDPEVKTEQRAQLVAAMEAMLAESPGSGGRQVPGQRSGRNTHRAGPLHKLRPRSRWSKSLAAGGLTVGVAAGAFSGVAAASSDALPGDSLYRLKRGMEDLELGMADGRTDRGEVYLGQASTRLHEARRLMERGRAGHLDHESLGEIRRALSGMRHDASEGHRLLHEAYERDGSLGPIQTLNTFSTAHRSGWRELRDRLPAQLTDVGDEVSSVFDAMDDEVGPLKSLLPAPPRGEREGSGTGGSDSHRRASEQPSPSSSTPSDGRTDGSGKPLPSVSHPDGKGLIGGTGDLLDPAATGGPPPTGRDDRAPKPDITLPPLLPGLLPGLGIEDETR